MKPNRRNLMLAAALGAALGVAAFAPGAAPALRADDMVMGAAGAKVVVTEYASVTCPHCAHWHEEVYPAFKKKWVDTGKVRFVFRELPTHPAEASVGGFLLARCAGKAGYFKVIDDLMDDQDALYRDGDGRGWLVRAGAKSGMNEAKVLACAGDEAAQAAFWKRVEDTTKPDNVTGTPTFLVNGEMLPDGDLATLDAAIARAGAK